MCVVEHNECIILLSLQGDGSVTFHYCRSALVDNIYNIIPMIIFRMCVVSGLCTPLGKLCWSY